MITVTTLQEAWDLAHKITGWNLEIANLASERAGYEIQRDCIEPENYICNLGNRLEINRKDEAKVTNIWIQPIEEKQDTNKFQNNQIKISSSKYQIQISNDSKNITITLSEA